jgi:hypothetical protein
MKTIADPRRRVTLPKSVAPGDVFSIDEDRPGRFVLVRLEKPARSRVKLSRKGGYLLASNGRRITVAETRTLQDLFP